MANTYTQIHIQIIFAVRYRQSVIHKEWQERLYQYITGIVQNYNHKVLQIGGMPDHVHLFVGMDLPQSSRQL
jgi:putative transposase